MAPRPMTMMSCIAGGLTLGNAGVYCGSTIRECWSKQVQSLGWITHRGVARDWPLSPTLSPAYRGEGERVGYTYDERRYSPSICKSGYRAGEVGPAGVAGYFSGDDDCGDAAGEQSGEGGGVWAAGTCGMARV